MKRGTVDVWRIGLTRPENEVSALQEQLDASERGRVNMFRAERDKRRFVVARATLRLVLSTYAGVAPHRLRINVRPGGKPVLARNSVSRALHFNLSHSGELALCAIADREVGVDLEQVRQHDDMERVARHFFSTVEARELEALSGIDRTHYFFRTWVRKEAYLKACGEGLARDTTRFTVREPSAGITLHTPDGSRVDDDYSVYDLPDLDYHFAAVALAADGTTPTIRYRDWPA